MDSHPIQTYLFPDDGPFPNNPTLPLILYKETFLPFGDDPPADIETRFGANGWPSAWRNGVYGYHHYHSRAHEVLGVYRGSAEIRFGGPFEEPMYLFFDTEVFVWEGLPTLESLRDPELNTMSVDWVRGWRLVEP